MDEAMPYTQYQSVYLYELELSDNEQIAINGSIDSDSLDCDPSVNGEYWLKSSGQIDGFVIELDSSGSFIGAAIVRKLNGDDRVWDIDYSVNDELYVGGSFSGTTDFDPTINQDLETSFGDHGYVCDACKFLSAAGRYPYRIKLYRLHHAQWCRYLQFKWPLP
jgi:hypothetical protein